MISTKINTEISTYREKFFLGLSIRQLVCGGIGAALAIATAVIGGVVCKLDTNLLGYLIILEVAPICALGFVQPQGYPFEKFAKIYCRWRCGAGHYAPSESRAAARSKKGGAQAGETPFHITRQARRARKKQMRNAIRRARKETAAAKKAFTQKIKIK